MRRAATKKTRDVVEGADVKFTLAIVVATLARRRPFIKIDTRRAVCLSPVQ